MIKFLKNGKNKFVKSALFENSFKNNNPIMASMIWIINFILGDIPEEFLYFIF